MFTGLIEEVGTVSQIDHRDNLVDFTIRCSLIPTDLHIGDSICVNGCCLTATSFSPDHFKATATPETLAVTSLGQLSVGSPVNLERSLTLQTRLGGHLVQGHVDGIGTVASILDEGESQRWTFQLPAHLTAQLVHKGSIAINGVSLTIADLSDDQLTVALIPKTIEATSFHAMKTGDIVNIETDLIGKYVKKFMTV